MTLNGYFLTMKPSSYGFTLVEILISIAIMSIVSIICIPYFNEVMAKQEAQRLPFLLTIHIQKARNAAVTYRKNVVICPTHNFEDCSTDWNSGLMMFIDQNRNRRHDLTEQILEQTDLDLEYGQLTWRGSLGIQAIALKPSSGPALGSMGSFYYCAQHGQAHKKVLLNKMAITRIESPLSC